MRRRRIQKDLNDPDNHDGVITYLEPDIPECEVKWALGSTAMNKTRGGDAIPVELFHILKYDAVKVLHSICHKFGKVSGGQKCSNYHTIVLFSHASKVMLKILQARLQ